MKYSYYAESSLPIQIGAKMMAHTNSNYEDIGWLKMAIGDYIFRISRWQGTSIAGPTSTAGFLSSPSIEHPAPLLWFMYQRLLSRR